VKKTLSKGFVGLLIATILLMAFMPNMIYAEIGLTLEKSHEWVTGDYSYSMADAVGDIDGDGVTEIVTAGYFYNSTLTFNVGEVNVWNWNGTDLSEEHKETFGPDYTLSSDTRFYAVALGNVDNETDTEVVLTGYGKVLGVIEQGMLIITSWNGTTMKREAATYWPLALNKTAFFGLAIGNVDKDNTTEIIAVGYRNTTTIFGTGFHGVITIWNVTENALTLETSAEWLISGDTVWQAVSIEDVDGDEDLEILIVGYFYDNVLNHECAVLRICAWDGSTLNWEASSQWYTYLDTYAYDIAAGDLDSDGTPEIVTIGYQKSDVFYAQLRIWSWDGDILTLRLSVEDGLVGGPFAFTAGKAVAIDDIDNDGGNEIITGVDISWLFWSMPIVRIFSWDGKTLTMEDSKDWEDATNLQDIVTCDVDDDGAVEIITAGYYGPFMAPGIRSELAIWSVSKVASSITVTVSPPSIVIGNQVTISGRVTNETGDTPISNVEVTIESSYEPLPVFITLGTVMTDENGQYTFTWIPPAAGNYIIMASWKGDFEREGASVTTTLKVEKASSMIALALSRYTAKIGDTIVVNGTLYPAKATPITLEYTVPDGTTTTKTVNSNNEGRFSDTFTANQVGEWKVKASWTGDEVHKGTESSPATLTVTKIQSSLSITASPLTLNVGENVTISGTLTPAQTASITVTYTMPNGTSTTRTVLSTSTGTFTDIIRLDKAGTWQVKASWNGNSQYEAAVSAPIAVTAEAVDQMTPIFAMAGLGLGVIALALALVGVYLALKKKAEAPKPPATAQAPPPT